MTKAVILESSLGATSNRGHPEHFVQGTIKVFSNHSIHTQLLIHKNNCGAVACGERVTPCLTHSLHEHISSDPYDGRLLDFFHCKGQLACDLDAVAAAVSDADLFLLPTATPRELAGLALWLQQRQIRARVAAIFHWGGETTFVPGTVEGALLRQAARDLSSCRPIAVQFRATHERLATGLTGPLSSPVILSPSMTYFGNDSSRRVKDRMLKHRSLTRMGILGGIRPEKGAQMLLEIAQGLRSLTSPIQLTVQAHGQNHPLLLLSESEIGVPIHVAPEWLPEDQMADLCSSLDVAVLPYDRNVYSHAVSGIFTFLSGLGVPCIVPSGTWMSDRIQTGETAGISYEGDSPSDIADALRKYMARKHELRLASANLASNWRSNYDATSCADQLVAFARTA